MSMTRKSFSPGMKVKVCECSGTASGLHAVVVHQREIKVDGRGIPRNVPGAYQPQKKPEVPIRYSDGTYDLMPWNRLIIIHEKKKQTRVKRQAKTDNHHWYQGQRYDVALGNPRYYDQGQYHSRVPVYIRDNKTGKIIERVGDGRQIGNFHPVWVNWNGKKVQVEKLLEVV